LQTVHYVELKNYEPTIVSNLSEIDMIGYDEAIAENRTFNLGTYSHNRLADNYRYEFFNLKNNMVIRIEIDGSLKSSMTIQVNETSAFTFFNDVTPSDLEINVNTINPSESLKFNLTIWKLTNSKEISEFASSFIWLVLFEYLVLTVFANQFKKKSIFEAPDIQAITNIMLTTLILMLIL
jgi:hypothetical protein